MEILPRFIPEYLLHDVVFVIDGESNMKDAYENDVCVSCA